jgi:hypothetical protein
MSYSTSSLGVSRDFSMLQGRFFKKDKEIQERWFRMKFHNKFGMEIKNLMLWKLHRKLNKEFLHRDKFIEEAISSTVTQYKKIDESNYPATKQFFNIGLYFLLAERDIQAVKADAFANPNKTKRNIALRTLLLTIYEWDMGKVTGRRMQFIYEATGLTEEAKLDVVSALKQLRKARKEIENQFSETRHNAIAHRGPDAMRQFEIISDLEIMKFSLALTTFYIASDSLLKAMVNAMLEMGSMKSLFHQLSYGEKST